MKKSYAGIGRIYVNSLSNTSYSAEPNSYEVHNT